MPQIINCPNCTQAMQVPDGSAGKQVRCPKCSTVFLISAPQPAAAGTSSGVRAAAGAAAAAPPRPAAAAAAPAATAPPPRPASSPSMTLPPPTAAAKAGGPKKCPSCGADLLEGAIACMDCGYL